MLNDYCALLFLSVLLLSTDHYLQSPYTNESTARSNSRKESAYEIVAAYTTCCILKGTENLIKGNTVFNLIRSRPFSHCKCPGGGGVFHRAIENDPMNLGTIIVPLKVYQNT